MITRILIVTFAAILMMPVSALMQTTESSQSLWSTATVAAKGQQHRKKCKPKAPRQSITRTFTSAAPITIPGKGQATPYPSAIAVSGFSGGTITDVDLILNDLSHGAPADIDMLLSAGDGRRALVMSDVGINGDSVIDIDLTLDDEAAAAMPVHTLSSGTFRPTDVNAGPDTFAPPAPDPTGNVALATFDGGNPNATWQLWVVDNVPGVNGDIGTGWALRITAQVDGATISAQRASAHHGKDSINVEKKRRKCRR